MGDDTVDGLDAAHVARCREWDRTLVPEAERLVAEIDPMSLDQYGQDLLDLLRRHLESPEQRVAWTMSLLQRHLETHPPRTAVAPAAQDQAPAGILDPDCPLPPEAQAEVEAEILEARRDRRRQEDAGINAELAAAAAAEEDYQDPVTDHEAETTEHRRPEPEDASEHETAEWEPGDGVIW